MPDSIGWRAAAPQKPAASRGELAFMGTLSSERAWGTVREDYSPDGTAWEYFDHDQSRSRAYRWSEDGLGGISDEAQRLCFGLALWNGRDSILKERAFGLTGSQGNRGEDVKECYFYLDATPSHSWLRYLYKYPQSAFPYKRLLEENCAPFPEDPPFGLIDSGAFAEGATGTWKYSMPRHRPRNCTSASSPVIADRTTPRYGCCRSSGFAILGRGRKKNDKTFACTPFMS